MFDRQAHEKRIQPYQERRFGMFIHWGLYAIPARGEWIRSFEEIPKENYEPYQDEFDPEDFDPKKWAKLAKKAGMRYAVFTAKHHDGFCLYDSAFTDFKSTNTRFGRDAVKEYLDAFRAEGIAVGLYYSLLDWHHEDYPHYGDERHPMRNHRECGNENRQFERYISYMHSQVKELCCNYGKIDIFWFDFSYADMRGEVWKGKELLEMVRKYQPEAVIDDRLETDGEVYGSLVSGEPTDCCGDFVSPERIIPPEGVLDTDGKEVPWESCITLNNHWGYCARDKSYKSARTIILKLVECVSKGGNLIVNVGPDANGRIPKEAKDILWEVGEWMDKNNKSIYGAGKAHFPKPENGRMTRKGNKIYYHITEPQIDFIPLYGIPVSQVKCLRLLEDGSECEVLRNWVTNKFPNVVFTSFGERRLPPEPRALPDETDTVIEVTLRDDMTE
jgi:alpha-L-fucosidase